MKFFALCFSALAVQVRPALLAQAGEQLIPFGKTLNSPGLGRYSFVQSSHALGGFSFAHEREGQPSRPERLERQHKAGGSPGSEHKEYNRRRKKTGHEGEAEHAAESEGHAKDEEAAEKMKFEHKFAFAACLMGGVALVMSLFYLVNSPRAEIQTSTWQVLNMTISIFCAVLIYGLIREVAAKLLVLGADVPIPKSMTIFLFVFVYFLFQATLCFCALYMKGRGTKAAGGLFAHITGFAASFLTAETQFMEPIKHSVVLTFAVALASGLLLSFMNSIAARVREQVIQADGRVDEFEDEWEDVAADAEKDMLALTFGFSLMQSFRFLIVGFSQPFEPDEAPEDIRQWETNALLGSGLFFAALVGVTAIFNATYLKRITKGSWPWYFVSALPSVMGMGMAWSLLFWGEWQVYCLGFEGVRIAGCMCVALVMSVVGVLSVFGLDHLRTWCGDSERFTSVRDASKLAIPQLVVAIGLLVGFAWERCFDMGLDTISELHGPYAHITTHVLQVALLIVVLPAWTHYVRPKAEA